MTKYTYIICHKNVRFSFWLFRRGCVVSASPSLDGEQHPSHCWPPPTRVFDCPTPTWRLLSTYLHKAFFKNPLVATDAWLDSITHLVPVTWIWAQAVYFEGVLAQLAEYLCFGAGRKHRNLVIFLQCKLVWEPRGCVFFFGYDCCDSFSGQFTFGCGERWWRHSLRIGKCWNWHLHSCEIW